MQIKLHEKLGKLQTIKNKLKGANKCSITTINCVSFQGKNNENFKNSAHVLTNKTWL